MAAAYKAQNQNTQRLLSMNDTLREKEEMSRLSTEELRRAKDEIAVLRRKVDQHNDLMTEKNERIQVCGSEQETKQRLTLDPFRRRYMMRSRRWS